MLRRPSKRNGAPFGFLKKSLLGFLLIAIGIDGHGAQQTRSSLVRLFELDGTLGTELHPKVISDDETESPGFTLIGARLEGDNLGFITRVRSALTIANRDNKRTITELEWRLDVYDAALRSFSTRVLQTDKVRIYRGETATASSRFGAVLPDRMIVLLQLIKVVFDNGSAWSPEAGCSLGEDLRTVTCKLR